MGPRRMWSVQLVWRYSPPTGRPYYATATWVVLASDSDEAAAMAANGLSTDGDVSNVHACVRAVSSVTDAGETVRRCRFDRWDGRSPSDFTPVTPVEL